MPKLTKGDVVHIAKLANLTLTKTEIEKFEQQLSTVLDYVSELNEVDTSNIEPVSQTTGLSNVLRKDQLLPSKSFTIDDALSGTENTHNGYFKAARIVAK